MTQHLLYFSVAPQDRIALAHAGTMHRFAAAATICSRSPAFYCDAYGLSAVIANTIGAESARPFRNSIRSIGSDRFGSIVR
jgi:hypothetical protein